MDLQVEPVQRCDDRLLGEQVPAVNSIRSGIVNRKRKRESTNATAEARTNVMTTAGTVMSSELRK